VGAGGREAGKGVAAGGGEIVKIELSSSRPVLRKLNILIQVADGVDNHATGHFPRNAAKFATIDTDCP
jgi:hypothetical protein